MINRKNLPLILALALPLVMIIAIAISIYLPGAGKHPKYNFLYATGSGAYYGYPQGQYAVSGGQLQSISAPSGTPPNVYPPIKAVVPDTHLYIYDVTKNIATEISFADAQKLKLDSSNSSPDGFTVERGNGGGSSPFGGGGDTNSWFIKGFNRAWKLNVKLSGTDYYNLQFLGWITGQ